MANRMSAHPLVAARRLSKWMLVEAGRELRTARIPRGMRQRDVAAALGTSVSHVCRVEHGQVIRLSVEALSRHAAAVGLKPFLRLYPLARVPLDRPQLELLERFRIRISPDWSFETEVPMPAAGDLRAADSRQTLGACSVLTEAFTRFADFQLQSRAALLKKRDLHATRLLLLVSATTTNRRLLREAGPIIREQFPLGTRQVLSAMADGRDPRADGIVLL